MAYSYQDIAAADEQQSFTFSVPYISRLHIAVYVDGVPVPFSFTGSFTILLNTPISGGGHTVRVKRATPIDQPIVDYANGSTLGESQLDATAQQAIYAAQEVADLINDIADLEGETIAEFAALAAAASATLAQTAQTLAEVAQVAAETAEAHAETAETNAETAETNAEAALAGALAAQTAAELAEAHAETAETNAETAEANAEAAQAGAESAQAIAEDAALDAVTAAGLVGNHNCLHNPLFNIWQQGPGPFIAVADFGQLADRWQYRKISAGVITVNRSTAVPSVAQLGIFSQFCLEVDVTTADASIAAGDMSMIEQCIEGSTWAPYAQRDLTLSFWVSSSKTGVHCVALRNAGTSDRTFVAEYTVNQANTFEFKTINIPASPSAGTWSYTNNTTGAILDFALMGGSTWQTTAGSWQTGDFRCTANQVNVLDADTNTFKLAGVKLELGDLSTAHNAIPWESELFLCQRYFQKSFVYSTAPAAAVGLATHESRFQSTKAGAVAGAVTLLFIREMRATPTMTYYSTSTGASAQMRDVTAAADCTATATQQGWPRGVTIATTGAAGTAVGGTLAIHWAAAAHMLS